MKEELRAVLKEKGEIYLQDICRYIPEAKGEFAMYMPTLPGYNKNVIWCINVCNDFIHAFNDLMIDEDILDWKAVNIAEVLLDNATIISGVELCNMRRIKGKKDCWMPIKIFLKKE
jgi:hypothetical protein